MKVINPLKINDLVYWAGILDEDLVTFDIVMETQYGTTYNSFLLKTDKIAVIDTVKKTFAETYIQNISKMVNPAEIEYIICNHTEPDHSGSVGKLLELAPDATVVGSGQAIHYLQEMIEEPFRNMKVKDGDVLSLGNRTLKFIGAPNLHWPDSIYTYLEEDKILFTCDSFGAHYCDEKMFDDQVSDYSDTFKYYFDVILKPYSKFMLKAIEKIRPLQISMICPGHGPILRHTWKDKVDISEKYAKEYLDLTAGGINQVLVTYISAYGFTKEMAEKIGAGIRKAGVISVELADIEHISLGDLEEKIVRSEGILVGSPTINQNTLLPVYKLFALINPIRDKGKLAASFGSYGWSGEAVKLIDDHLRNLKLDVVQAGLATKFYPGRNKTEELEMFGENFGKLFLERRNN
ncbi:MAG: MBL fold metallo-hydrolase [Bacteroides sp. SM23_62_1]|nr:MAG: MBL fold metallo-hydrolase [Bacteroides sp. SM23_62_1]